MGSLSLQAARLDGVLGQVEGMVANAESKNDTNREANLSLAITLVAGVDLHCKPVTPDIAKGYSEFRKLLHRELLPPWTFEGGHDDSTVFAGQFQEAMWNAC